MEKFINKLFYSNVKKKVKLKYYKHYCINYNKKDSNELIPRRVSSLPLTEFQLNKFSRR